MELTEGSNWPEALRDVSAQKTTAERAQLVGSAHDRNQSQILKTLGL